MSDIRPATEVDAPAILRLLGQLGYSLEDEGAVGRILADPAHAVFVAEANSGVVGYVNANIRFQLHHAAPVVTIDELCVDEGSRNGGIGAQLVETVLELARECGADTVEVTSNLRRQRAIAFYQRQGFELTSSKLVLIL